MDIQIKWFADNFNVGIASKEGAEPFVEIKGCRIVDGQNGSFVSYPSRKQDSGKYWNHVYGSDKFNAVVLSKALEAKPAAAAPARQRAPAGGADDDVPFADPLKSRAFCLAV